MMSMDVTNIYLQENEP